MQYFHILFMITMVQKRRSLFKGVTFKSGLPQLRTTAKA